MLRHQAVDMARIPGPQTDGVSACRIRPYNPTTDHPHVQEICKDVYGGTDALPGMINAQFQEHGTEVFACVEPSDSGSDVLHSLVCCQRRGSAMWVWGTRTRPERRGQGLARQLMMHVESLAREMPGVDSMLSTTILANSPMRRIFEQLGYVHGATVDLWPGYEAHAALAAATDSAASGGPHSLISLLPGLADLVHGAQAIALAPHWQQCRSLPSLTEALVALRQRRTGSAQHAATAAVLDCSETAAHSVFAWLPGDYVLWPVDSPAVEAMLQAGQLWVLDHGSGQDRMLGVLLVMGNGHLGVPFAGVVVDRPAVLEAAVAKACALQPISIKRFYVDRCDAFDHEALFALGGSRNEFITLHKVLEADGTEQPGKSW